MAIQGPTEQQRIQTEHKTTPIKQNTKTSVTLIDPKEQLNKLSKSLMGITDPILKADGFKVSFQAKKLEHWGVKVLRSFFGLCTLGISIGIEKLFFNLRRTSHLDDATKIVKHLFENVIYKKPTEKELENYINIGKKINEIIKKTNDKSFKPLDLKILYDSSPFYCRINELSNKAQSLNFQSNNILEVAKTALEIMKEAQELLGEELTDKQQENVFDLIHKLSSQITNHYQKKITQNKNAPDESTKEFLQYLVQYRDAHKDDAQGRIWDMCNSIYESITESYEYLNEAEKQIPGLKNMLCLDEEVMKNALIEVQELFQESVSYTPGDQANKPNTAIFHDYNPNGTAYCILTESPQGIKIHQFIVSGDKEKKLLVKQMSKKPHTIPYEKMDDLKKILQNHKVLFAGEKPSEIDPFKDLKDYSQDARKGG